MPSKPTSFILLLISGALLVAALFMGAMPLSLRILVSLLFAATSLYWLWSEISVHRALRERMDSLQALLFNSFNEILKESSQDIGLNETLEILESETPESMRRKDLFQQLEVSRSLFNKEINLFREKNRTIKDLNDKILFSKQQLEAVFDAQDDALCMVDAEMRIFRLNKAFARYCNADIRSLLGQKSHTLFPGIVRISTEERVKKVFATGAVVTSIPFESLSSDDKLHFLYSAFPICEGERVAYVLEHIRNVTSEKKMNEQLIRSANLASIGTMIAGIAHEMNNPLSGISGCSTNMLTMAENYGLNEKGRARIQDILESANRAEAILKNLLDLSRKKESQFLIMNIMPVLEKSFQSIHIQGYAQVKKTLTIDPGLRPVINCDPSRITQVFINLLSNATFSVLDRFKAEAVAGREDSFQPEIRVQVKAKNSFLLVSVIDNGLGIPQEKVTQIFDPFFTTRPPGQGTGLGLSICQKIMLEHNGRINVESIERGNTCFTVEFPLTGA